MSDSIDHQKNEDFAQVFSTGKGPAVLREIMSFCGFFAPPGAPISELGLAYDSGKRDVAMEILNRTNWDLDPNFVRKQLEASYHDYKER